MSRYWQHLAAIWTDNVLAFHPFKTKHLDNRTMGLHSGTTHGSTIVNQIKLLETLAGSAANVILLPKNPIILI